MSHRLPPETARARGTFRPDVYAIYFGTSNALLSPDGVHPPTAFDPCAVDPTVHRLYLPEQGLCSFRSAAFSVENGMGTRRLCSLKRFLPSRAT